MKKIKLSLLGIVTFTLFRLFVVSCSNENVLNEELVSNELVSPMMNPKFSAPFVGTVEYCGEVKVTDLLAGQHHLAGNVTVGNDENYVYVTYNTENGWLLKAVHLFVGDLEDVPLSGGGNPQNGHFPVNESFDPLKTTVTYQFEKDALSECMIVAAHAEVVKIVDGEQVAAETAWGKGEGFPGNNWSMYFDFCKQECIPPPPPVDEKCYNDETAWAFGDSYVKKGNWATYTEYVAGKEVEIYAGQKHLAGYATFSDVVDGKVTISIELINDWISQDVNEALKIQGYDAVPPAKNPAPGQFKTYKGAIVQEVVVDAYAYYGIHFDVRKVVPCPEETEN